MNPGDLEFFARQADEGIRSGLALTTIAPEHLAALVSAALGVEFRDRIDLQQRTIAAQAREIDRLKGEIAAAIEAANGTGGDRAHHS